MLLYKLRNWNGLIVRCVNQMRPGMLWWFSFPSFPWSTASSGNVDGVYQRGVRLDNRGYMERIEINFCHLKDRNNYNANSKTTSTNLHSNEHLQKKVLVTDLTHSPAQHTRDSASVKRSQVLPCTHCKQTHHQEYKRHEWVCPSKVKHQLMQLKSKCVISVKRFELHCDTCLSAENWNKTSSPEKLSLQL